MSAAPTLYSRQNHFVSDATNNPNITVAQIATPLDAEYTAIATSVNQTISRLGEIQRDDGLLLNGIVRSQSMSTEVLNLLNIDRSELLGEWATARAYAVRDVVSNDGGSYMCVVAHTSSDFPNDITAGRWLTLQSRPANNALRALRFTSNGSQRAYTLQDNTELNATNIFIDGVYQQKNSYTVFGQMVELSEAPPSGAIIEITYGTIADLIGIGALSVTQDKIADGAVTQDKLEDGAVISAKIANNAVITSKIATNAVDSTKVSTTLFSDIAPVGAVLKSAFIKNTVTNSTAAVIPADNTIPQITEGRQILSANITPLFALNKIRGRVALQVAANVAGGYIAAAVFRGSAVNAIASCGIHITLANYMHVICFEFEDLPNALTQQTYTVRYGSNAGAVTATVNNALFGGTMGSSLTLEEIKG
jgi:hypothetical protein